MDDMDLSKYIEEIKTTGFKLEYDVSTILKNQHWNVISNKYYIDDSKGTVREIDLVAYKVSKIQCFYVYTVLIISCKKNEKCDWALLSKERDQNDPNANLKPIHLWSNHKVLDYIINQEGWAEEYFSTNNANGSDILSLIENYQIFAFQEMNKTNGKNNNDKNIFNSITSLMKAQSYEINSLESRKKEPAVYQFNLLSVIDTNLVRINFSSGEINALEVEDEIYVADYIIQNQQTSSKIHFINFNNFSTKLTKYDQLHEANVDSFNEKYDFFFENVHGSFSALNLFCDDIAKKMIWPVQKCLSSKSGINSIIDLKIKDFCISRSFDGSTIDLGIDLSLEDISYLNNNDDVCGELKQNLYNILRYDGESKFETLIPF